MQPSLRPDLAPLKHGEKAEESRAICRRSLAPCPPSEQQPDHSLQPADCLLSDPVVVHPPSRPPCRPCCSAGPSSMLLEQEMPPITPVAVSRAAPAGFVGQYRLAARARRPCFASSRQLTVGAASCDPSCFRARIPEQVCFQPKQMFAHARSASVFCPTLPALRATSLAGLRLAASTDDASRSFGPLQAHDAPQSRSRWMLNPLRNAAPGLITPDPSPSCPLPRLAGGNQRRLAAQSAPGSPRRQQQPAGPPALLCTGGGAHRAV